MASLLDAIRGNNQQVTQPQEVTDETQGLSSLLRAKSGKAVGGPSTALSNLGEQSATRQSNQQAQQVGQKAELATQGQEQQASGIEQQKQAQLTGIGQQRQANNMQTNIRVNQTLQDLEQNKGKIDQSRYQAGLEQVGQNLRLQNQQYVDNLQREGNTARLDDANSFKENLQQSVFGDQQDLLQKQLGNKSILDVNARQYSEAMANMGVYDSYAMFQAAMKNEQDRALYTGAGSLATAGIGAYGKLADKSDTSTPAAAAPSSGTGDYSTTGGTNGNYNQFSGKD